MALGVSQSEQRLRQQDRWTTRAPLERPLWARGRRASADQLFARYLEGWAQADPARILAAVAPGYRFRDPLVGAFTAHSLSQYFDILQARCARAGATSQGDLAFFLHGPIEAPFAAGERQFCREAPRIGLIGIARIDVTAAGVIAESVAYDLNLASDLLRGPASG